MRILLSENKSLKQKILSGSLALFLSFCIALSGMSFAYADEFDDQAAQNGKNFTPVPDNEKTSFLLFGSGASGGDGMQGRWEMLTKDEMMSISNNTTAREFFDAGSLAIWKSGQNFSTTTDGKNLTFDLGAAGINIKNLASNYKIKSGGNNDKSRLLIVDQDGKSVSSRDYALEYPRYYFSDMTASGVQITPLLKISNGVFSLRTGQDKATEVTADLWKDDIKTLQIDTITTATAKPDVVLSILDGKTEVDCTLSDVVYSGQYDAVFAYRNAADEQITAAVRGARLSDVLAAKSIKIASGDTLYGLDANGASIKLNSPVSQYFLAYEGTETKEDATESALTSNSEFVMFGPGTTENQVKIKDIYTIKINRAPAPAPVVKKPPATKITKLTKPTRRSIRIRWAKKTGIAGYQIRMATKRYGTYKLIKTVKSAKTTTFVKKKLKKGKTYFFKIRTYKKVNGKTYYSKWSAVKYKKL